MHVHCTQGGVKGKLYCCTFSTFHIFDRMQRPPFRTGLSSHFASFRHVQPLLLASYNAFLLLLLFDSTTLIFPEVLKQSTKGMAPGRKVQSGEGKLESDTFRTLFGHSSDTFRILLDLTLYNWKKEKDCLAP